MRYYRTSKSSKKQAKMEFKKFCPKCRARILHKEKKK
jgi:ribosomal protein L33